MHTDRDACLRAVRGRDARFDGCFVTAVRTTRIYCRPSCPATPPRPHNIDFLPTAAAAQLAGYRACKRCRPDASPGSPAWDHRGDVVARALRLVADGVVDREGVPGLAARLGYGRRQVERLLAAEVGAGPLGLARAQRAQTARALLESTDLPVADVAFAAGFGSVRQCNETVRAVYDLTPLALRARASRPGSRPGGPRPTAVELRLPLRPPFAAEPLLAHLAATAVPGVEEWRDEAYRRTLRLPHGHGVVALRARADHVLARLHLQDLRDLPAAVARCRFLLDLDADPVAVDTALAEDPVLAPLVAAHPGVRVPRTVDAAELAVRAVLGQQVSTSAARTHAGRLVLACGTPVEDPEGGLTHLFPTPDHLASALEQRPELLGVPARRRATVVAVARHLADHPCHPGVDRDEWVAGFLALPGVGPWTASTVRMRALGDPDAFLPGDLGVVQQARALGLPTGAALLDRSRAWRPWRAYAVQLLWAASDHPVARLPRPGRTP